MRELTLIKIGFLSLVPRIKNRLPMRFNGSATIEVKNLVLNSGDGRLTVVVFDPAPGFADCLVAPDLLRKTAYEFMRAGANLDTRHNGRAISKKRAAVVESYFVQEGDGRFLDLVDYEGDPVDATGAWVVVIELYDKDLKALYQEANSWNGVSIFGEAEFTKGRPPAAAKRNGSRAAEAGEESLFETFLGDFPDEDAPADALPAAGRAPRARARRASPLPALAAPCGPVVDGRLGYGLPLK